MIFFFLFDTKNKRKIENKQVEPRQTTSFCTVKKIINKMKRQPMDWEKMFANDISDGD